MTKDRSFFAKEILVTVFLIILLSALCVKKVKDLKILAQESISQKNEQIIREALAVYRGDNEGLCPIHLEALKGDYLDSFPPYYHKGQASDKIKEGSSYKEVFDGSGGWVYINNKYDKDYCEIYPNVED
ncbi:MAG: hypothetical protein J6S61_01160 [Elusimicrobiaceae bacterium]|nr:hypothetical protein [Elusimicrobiaceae bacterium]